MFAKHTYVVKEKLSKGVLYFSPMENIHYKIKVKESFCLLLIGIGLFPYPIWQVGRMSYCRERDLNLWMPMQRTSPHYSCPMQHKKIHSIKENSENGLKFKLSFNSTFWQMALKGSQGS